MIEDLNKYTVKDKKYRISAITTTMSKFGPSGSLKSENSIFEHAMDVMPKISNEVFFDLKYIFVIVLQNLRAGDWYDVGTLLLTNNNQNYMVFKTNLMQMYISNIIFGDTDQGSAEGLESGRDILQFSLVDLEEVLDPDWVLRKIFAKHTNEVSVREMKVEVPRSKICQIIMFLKDNFGIMTHENIDLVEILKKEIAAH